MAPMLTPAPHLFTDSPPGPLPDVIARLLALPADDDADDLDEDDEDDEEDDEDDEDAEDDEDEGDEDEERRARSQLRRQNGHAAPTVIPQVRRP